MPRGHGSRRASVVAVLVAVLALGGAVAGCGSGGESTTQASSTQASTSAASAPKDLGTLKVGHPAPSDISAMIGVSSGIFKDLGLNVEITPDLGANIINAVSSGQVDVGMHGTTTPLVLESQGKPMKIINSWLGGGVGGSVAVKSDSKIKTVDDLKAMGKDCTVTGFPVGTSPPSVAKQLGLGCRYLALPNGQAQAAAVLSGHADAWIGAGLIIGPVVTLGKVRYILESKIGQNFKELGRPYSESANFVLASTAKTKGPQLVAFEKGLAEARKLIREKSSAELLDQYLMGFEGIKALPRAAALAIVASNKEFGCGATDNCYITRAEWDYWLQRYKSFGIPNYNPADPKFSYDSMVDMSFYDAANGVPKG